MTKFVQMLLMAATLAVSVSTRAGLVSGVGANVESIDAVSPVSGRLLILAGRRPAGKDFGPYADVGLIDVSSEGGTGSFLRIPELDGSRADDFRHAFGQNGELWFIRTKDSGGFRLGRFNGARSFNVDVPLPAQLREGDVKAQGISLSGDGMIELAMSSQGEGVLVVLNPDASFKSARPIRGAAEFQSITRIPGSGYSVVASASGGISLVGNLDSRLSLRGPDLNSVGLDYEDKGLIIQPVVNSQGTRVAFASKTALLGRVVVTLLSTRLEKVGSATIIEKRSFTGPVGLVFVQDHLVSVHADTGRCFANTFSSADGKLTKQREISSGNSARCIAISGLKAGAGVLLVISRMSIVGGMPESVIETAYLAPN